MGYLGKALGIQTEEQRDQTFLKIVLKGKLCKAVQFVCDREKGGFFNQKNWLKIIQE